MKKILLGRLKKIGLTAPQDEAFLQSVIKTTSYAHFVKFCDTNGRKGKGGLSTGERFHEFIKEWFPATLRGQQEEPFNLSIF